MNKGPQCRAYQTWMREKAFQEAGWSPEHRQARLELLYPPYDVAALTALETASMQASRLNEDAELVKAAFGIEFAIRTEPHEDFVAKRLFRQSYLDNGRNVIAPPWTPPPLSQYTAARGHHGATGCHHGAAGGHHCATGGHHGAMGGHHGAVGGRHGAAGGHHGAAGGHHGTAGGHHGHIGVHNSHLRHHGSVGVHCYHGAEGGHHGHTSAHGSHLCTTVRRMATAGTPVVSTFITKLRVIVMDSHNTHTPTDKREREVVPNIFVYSIINVSNCDWR